MYKHMIAGMTALSLSISTAAPVQANGLKVLFVPSARLEFRITEFSWRDIPYFMYKRSEITAHGTRDYLNAKWKVNFPNTVSSFITPFYIRSSLHVRFVFLWLFFWLVFIMVHAHCLAPDGCVLEQ